MAGETAPISGVPDTAPAAVIEAATAAPASVAAVETSPVAEVVSTADPVAADGAPTESLVAPETPATETVADAKPPEDIATVEAEPVVVAPLAYEAFKLPEGFTPAEEQIKAFSELAGQYQIPQEQAQQLIDLHTSELKAFAEREAQRQQDVFAETNKQWIAQVDKAFGNRRDTVVNDARSFITRLVPDADKRSEIYKVLAFTGAGNHPAIIGLMASAEKKMNERGAPPQAVPGGDRRGQSAAEKRYGAGT
jgi:hypothetical protein